jgi:excisionase family DNA binding protein
MPPERATYTVEQVGELLGISRGSAYAAVRAGELPGVIRLGRRVLISKAALHEFLGISDDGPDSPTGAVTASAPPQEERKDGDAA